MKPAALVLVTILAATAATPVDDLAQSSPVVQPTSTGPCRRSDKKNLNACIKRNIVAHVPRVRNGGRYGLMNLEPLYAPKVSLDLRTGILDFTSVMSNVSVYGLTHGVVRDVRADVRDDTLRMDVDVTIPNNPFRGDLDITNGRILGMSFKGHGTFDITMLDVKATWRVLGRRRPGETYMHIDSVTPTYTVGGMKTDIKLPNDYLPDLDRVINAVMNQYWSIMVEMGKPVVQKTLSHYLWLPISTVFENVPYDEMFPA